MKRIVTTYRTDGCTIIYDGDTYTVYGTASELDIRMARQKHKSEIEASEQERAKREMEERILSTPRMPEGMELEGGYIV